MRCKYINSIDVDWDHFKHNQEHAGYQKFYKGISVIRQKRERFFCSCGEMGTEFRDTCPKCGGFFMKFNDDMWRTRDNELGGAYKDVDQIKFSHFTFETVYPNEETVKLICVENNHAIYDLRKSEFTSLNFKNINRGIRISNKGLALIKHYFPDFVASPFSDNEALINNDYMGREFCSWVSKLVATSFFPNIFSSVNAQKYPKTTKMLLSFLINSDLGSMESTPLVDDLKTLCIDLGFTEELFPIIDEVASTDFHSPWMMERLKDSKLSDFFETNVGALMLSKIKHGTLSLAKCLSFATSYRSLELDEESESLFISFCKESMDMYSSENILDEFTRRMRILKEMGIFINEDSLRSRNFFKVYNLANFRKTLKNTDVESLIQKDPLKLISRIR